MLVLSALVFIPLNGNCPLFDWDEINFAECAREMLLTGNYSQVQMHFRPFWEKPPLFIWLQAASMHIFGVSEFAARFPNALCGVLTLFTLFRIGSRLHSLRFGLVWALTYAATMLPHLFFRSGIIDPWFNLFIFLSVYQLILVINNPGGRRETVHALLGGLFIGLAVITKGPAALLILALTLTAHLVLKRDLSLLRKKNLIFFAASGVFFSLLWFIIEFMRGNGDVIREFISYQLRLFQTGDAGHEGPFYYHALVLLTGCFPASVLFLLSYSKKSELTPFQALMRRFMLILFWTVLILFSIVKTKIVHYSSLCYFPITFIASFGIVHHLHLLKAGKGLRIVYWLIASLLSLALISIGFTDKLKPLLLKGDLIRDEFARQNLSADVHWSGAEPLIGVLLLALSFALFAGLRHQSFRTIVLSLSGFVAFIAVCINVLVPKVEQYTQHAAIEFYKAAAIHHCYVETHNFKSYAYLFYSRAQPGDFTNPDQLQSIARYLDDAERDGNSRYTVFATANCVWLKLGKIDRPAYMVCKTKDEKDLLSADGFRKLYDKNGFSFFVRMPVK